MLTEIMVKVFRKSEVKKVLCIKPRGIGDIILSTIILKNLKSFFQDITIDYLTEEFAKDAVSTNPLVSKILTYKKDDSIFSIIRRVRKEKYDMVLDLWSNPKSAQITFFSGAKYRVGYSYRGRRYAYNFKAKSGRGNYHSAEHNLELLKILDIPIFSREVNYYLDKLAEDFANSFVINKVKSKYLIGIILSGGWDSKKCPKEKWVEIIKNLSEHIDCTFLILWGPDDYQEAKYIEGNSKFFSKVILAPKTDLKQLAGLISKCDLIITNDSGPMHLAAALGIPTLGLFGPTDPKKHGPYSKKSDYVIKSDLHCIICNKLICPFNKECFYNMNSSEIIEKSIRLLSKK